MDVYEVNLLCEEIMVVFVVFKLQDQVVLCLESSGGMVYGYGLVVLQLQCLCDKNIFLIVMVDKVVVSGGYMMVCVVDKIVFVLFVIVGFIGVVV